MSGVNTIIKYFDLQAHRRGAAALQGRGDGPQGLTVFPQYLALVAGILVQPYLDAYRKAGQWFPVETGFVGWAAFSLIAGLIVFPAVYRKSFDPDQPRLVQWCTIFVAGVGWKSLFATAAKLGGAA